MVESRRRIADDKGKTNCEQKHTSTILHRKKYDNNKK